MDAGEGDPGKKLADISREIADTRKQLDALEHKEANLEQQGRSEVKKLEQVAAKASQKLDKRLDKPVVTDTSTYKIKVRRLLYVVMAAVAVIIVAVVAVVLLSGPSGVVNVGNNWNYISGNQPFSIGGRLYYSFVGIEGCQYCAIERYAIFEALSKFGNWTYFGRKLTLNTVPVNNMSTNPESRTLFYLAAEGDWTFNFLNQNLSYSSQYIDFNQVEVDNNLGASLQQPNQIQLGYIDTYDPSGAVPFSVIGGNFYEIGSGSVLDPGGKPIIFAPNGTGIGYGYSPVYIIGQFNQTGSTINTAINTEADYISAMICYDLSNTPPVCSSQGILSVEDQIKAKL